MNPSSNKLFGMLYNSMTIENAFSMFFFEKNTAIQEYMHYFKYKRHNEIGIELGEMYAKEIIKNKNLKNKFDIIIPIPLHKKKYEERGYNQSEMFAIGLNKIFNIEVDTTSVIRIKNTKSQTSCKDTKERFSNVKDAFKIIIPEKLNNKHILLVDDLITAGATMISCVNEIKSKCNCKISICSICRTL
jgi:ComF family protein